MFEGLAWGLLVLIATFDIYWIFRLVLSHLCAYYRPKLRHDEMGVVYNICWTTDIDYLFHMNNGKYFRELDFARFDWYARVGFAEYISKKLNKMYFVQHGACIRYRRPINFLVPFKVVTKLVYWDDRSFYFEQSFVSLHDGFTRAVALCKNTAVGGTVKEMLTDMGMPTSPPSMPDEISLWIQSQEISSNRLKSRKEEEEGKINKEEEEINIEQEGERNVEECVGSTVGASDSQSDWEVLDQQKSKDD